MWSHHQNVNPTPKSSNHYKTKEEEETRGSEQNAMVKVTNQNVRVTTTNETRGSGMSLKCEGREMVSFASAPTMRLAFAPRVNSASAVMVSSASEARRVS